MNKVIIAIVLMCSLIACTMDDVTFDDELSLRVLTLDSAVSITGNSAVIGGKLIASDSHSIVKYGVCYSLYKNIKPESDSTITITVNEMVKTSFLIPVENLKDETIYYAKVFVSDSNNTVYGKEITFKTAKAGGVNVPALTTDSVVDITPEGAVVYGNVVAHGGAGVYERGVCVSTSPNPTVENTVYKSTSTGIGVFNALLSGLINQTKYYVRAYAKNSVGISYGEEMSFVARVVMKLSKVKLTSKRASQIDFTTATIHVQITDNGGEDPVEIGAYVGTSATSLNSKFTTTLNSVDGEGRFSLTLTNLEQNTTYYARGFAKNSEGESLTTEIARFHTAISHEGFKYMVLDTIITIRINNEVVQLEFLDRNIGSPKVAEGVADYLAYGYLYQFGRRSDGHQVINWTSATSGTLNLPAADNANAPVDRTTADNSPFYKGGAAENVHDWVKAPAMASTNPLLNYYWSAVKEDPNYSTGGTNNPCPPGFRLPTAAELSELNKIITKREDAYNLLKLPSAGYIGADGVFKAQGATGGVYIWGADIGTATAVATNKTVNYGAYSLFTSGRAVRGMEKSCALTIRAVRIVK